MTIFFDIAGKLEMLRSSSSEGKMVGRPEGSPVIVPGGLPMYLTATGREKREAVVLILLEKR